jgi:hypothetical protein
MPRRTRRKGDRKREAFERRRREAEIVFLEKELHRRSRRRPNHERADDQPNETSN